MLAGLPAAAQAEDDTWISGIAKAAGDPLEVAVGEGASLHANLDGSGPSDVFWFDEAGLTLALPENGGVRTYGTIANEGDSFRPVSLPVVSGSGTSADPWTITSTWNAGDPARMRVTEVVRFTDGSQRFRTTWSVENVSGAPVSFRAYLSAWVAGNFCVPVARSNGTVPESVGVAVPLDGGPRDPNDPVFDGLDFGRATDLEPDPSYPWARAVAGEGSAGATLAISQGNPLPSSLPARTDGQALLAAEWDGYAPGKAALAPGASYTIGASLHHASALRAPPMIASALDTAPHTLDVYTDTADGGPLANERLGWYIESYSHRVLTGTMTTDSTGHASLTWTSDGQDHDDVTVWIDRNGNGRWDRDTETTRKTQVEWVDETGVSWGGHDTPGSGTTGTDVIATGGGVTGVSGEPATGTGTLPAGTQPVTTTRASMRIGRLATRRIGPRAIRILGRASTTTSKLVAFALRTRKGKLLGRAYARVKAGRFAVRMRLTRAARPGRYRLAISYAGDNRIRPLNLKRTQTLK